MTGWRLTLSVSAVRNLTTACLVGSLCVGSPAFASEQTSALSDEPIPLQTEAVAQRVKPILELGDTFLGQGNIDSGIKTPTGAVWQPNLLIWGNYRSAVDAFKRDSGTNSNDRSSEWVNRVDLFAQLSLSQSDRIVVGLRPLDEDGDFTGYRFEPRDQSIDGSNSDVSIAFFEGNLAELFPNSGNKTRRGLDIDISVGRMPWLFQEGTLINDRIDSIALARNNLLFVPGSTNTRIAAIYGWNNVNRADNLDDRDAKMFGVFAETDFRVSTVNFDVVQIKSDLTGDGLYVGLSASQRLGKYNTAFRIVHSESQGRDTLQTTTGSVAVAEISWTPAYTHNNVYSNFFWSFDDFSSASRDAATGGPLGLVGILYAATGLGRFPAPLGNDAIESFGGALGYQMFFKEYRSQLILELGARTDTNGSDRRQFGLGARFQQALGKRLVLRFDVYVADRERFDTDFGGRMEIQLKL